MHFGTISAGDPFQRSLDALPELNEAACLDIDLNPVINEGGFQVFLPLMDTLEPRWQQFLRDQVFRTIDAGAEGVIIDEFQGNSTRPGCFNQVDMAGFREFLQEQFTPQELQIQFGIVDIETFDYGEFIRSMGMAETWKEHFYQVPLSMDFQNFQILSLQEFWTDLITESKQYAQQTYGRDHLFSGNVSALEQFSIMFAKSLDFYTLEFPYFDFIGFPPAGKTLPTSKLSRAFRDKKAIFVTQVPTNEELVRRGNVNNLMKLYIAESYAGQSEFIIPFKIFSGGLVPYSADLSVIAPYYAFIQDNRFLYEKIQLLNPKVGLLYSFPSNFHAGFEFLNNFYGASYALLDSQIQHDVLFSGDDFMLQDTLTSEQLNEYDVIVLPGSRNLSDSQVRFVLDYVGSGGTVVAWGEIGIADERNRLIDSSERPELNALTTPGSQSHGDGDFVYFSEDLGNNYFDDRTIDVRDTITQEIFARIDRQLEADAPNNVDVLAYTSETDEILIFHIINYNYDIDTDTITPIPNFDFAFQLPTGFEMVNKQLYLLSPDREDPELLTYQQSGNTISATIEGVQYYDVLAVVPEAFASSEAQKAMQQAELAREESDFLGLDTSSVTSLFEEIARALAENNFLKAKTVANDVLTVLAQASKPTVLFDETHDEVHTLSEERALQLNSEHPESHFLGEFKKNLSLDYELASLMEGEITPEKLEDASVLILASPSDPSFSPEEKIFSQSEIAAIVDFVRGGGGLFFMGDCCLFSFFANNSSINDLLSNFGIQFVTGGLKTLNSEDSSSNFIFDVERFIPHPVTANVGAIRAVSPGHLTVTGPAEALAFTGSDTFPDPNGNGVQDPSEDSGPFVFAAAANLGPGKVVVLAGNHFTDGIYQFERGQEPLLIRNILGWLTERNALFLSDFKSTENNFTGVAFTNPGGSDAELLLKAFDQKGLLLEGPGITNPVTLQIPAGQQTAQLARELFSFGTLDQEGWIEVLKKGTSVVGFSLQGDTGSRFLDGTDFQGERSSHLIFPEITLSNENFTKIFLSNPDEENIADLRVQLFDGVGNRLGSFPTSIPPKGSIQFTPDQLFDASALDQGYLEAISDIEITGFELFGSEEAVGTLNGISVDEKQALATVLYSAQLASGNSFFTELNIVNHNAEMSTLTITAFDATGNQIGTQSVVSLATGEQLKEKAAELFALDPGEDLITGWIKAESSNTGIIGNVTFGTPDGRLLASLPLEDRKSTDVVFSHVAQGAGFYTGIGILNPNQEPTDVTIEVFGPQGTSAGQTTVTLTPGERAAKLLNELIPGSSEQVGGFVTLESSQEIIAFQFFGNDESTFLSAVPAQ